MRVLLCSVLAAGALAAQDPPGDSTARTPKTKKFTEAPLFADSKPIELTLSAPFGRLRKERGGTPPYHWATFTYAGDSGQVRVPLRVRTRGIWRRRNCDIPPLRLNFNKDSSKKTIFRHLDGARLVMHCRNTDDYEQYVLQEFNLYRVQRLLTPLSFDVRLARVTYVDAEKKDTLARRWAFLLEDENTFGERFGGKVVNIKGASARDLDPRENALFGVWQYFVANTDFSVAALHNVALLQKDTAYYPVAYDYDWTGAVNARYSTPAPQLRIRRTTDRLMRGYCSDSELYDPVFAKFREKKDSIYALYRDEVAAPMKRGVVESTLKYFDEFYEIINDPRLAKKLIVDACLGGVA